MSSNIRLVVQGNSISVSNNTLRRRREYELFEYKEKMSKLEKYWRELLRRSRRRINTFLKMLGKIENKPKYFISISFPPNYKRSYLRKRKEILRKFRRSIRTQFKDSWFISKLEWSYNSWIHMHLIGSFSKDNVNTEDDEKKLINIWNKLVHSNDRRLVDIREYSKQSTYLAKKSKRYNDAFCIQIIKNDLSISYINAKNITFSKKMIKYYNQFIMLIFQYKYLKAIIENGHKPDSVIEQFSKKDFHITAFDDMHLERIVNETEKEYTRYRILINNGNHSENDIEFKILRELNNYLLCNGIQPYITEEDFYCCLNDT